MFFLARAAFWIGVVALFMPGDPAADAVAGEARSALEGAARIAQDETYTAVADICVDNIELCTATVDAVDGAQDLAVEGLTALAAAIDEDQAGAATN